MCQPLTEILFPLVLLPGGCLYFQSISKLSKSVLSNRFLSFPPLDFKHPDILLLTYLYFPICCHSFQIRQVWYCYPLNEFFIPSLYCYSCWIPETLLLAQQHFIRFWLMTEPFRIRQVWYCYPLNEFFIPRLYFYNIWGFLNCYCLHNNISFVSFFRSSDW
jgi:hypothetical protein